MKFGVSDANVCRFGYMKRYSIQYRLAIVTAKCRTCLRSYDLMALYKCLLLLLLFIIIIIKELAFA